MSLRGRADPVFRAKELFRAGFASQRESGLHGHQTHRGFISYIGCMRRTRIDFLGAI